MSPRSWNSYPQSTVHIQRYWPGGDVLCLKELYGSFTTPKVLVTPTLDIAKRLLKDLHGAGFQRVFLLPQWEPSPFSGLHPTLACRYERINALMHLELKDYDFLVLPGAAFIQKVIPLSILGNHFLNLQVGQSYDLVTLREQLKDLGYFIASSVQQMGQAAFRGYIVDLYPPIFDEKNNHDLSIFPRRLEFFGDELESIRAFDPKSQRSLPETSFHEMHVPTTLEFPFDRMARNVAKKNLKNLLDHLGLARIYRDQMNRLLEEGIPDLQFDPLSALFVDQPDTTVPISQCLSQNQIILWEPQRILQELERSFEKLHLEWEKVQKQDLLVPSWDQFVEPKSILEDLAQKSCAIFSQEDTPLFKKIELNQEGLPEIRSRAHLGESVRKILSQLKLNAPENYQLVILGANSSQKDYLNYLNEDLSLEPILYEQYLISESFLDHEKKSYFLLADELFGQKKTKESPRHTNSSANEVTLDIQPNDLVIHKDHGLGRFKGFTHLTIDRIEQDFVLLEYAHKDKLYLPVYRLNLLQKYIGAEGSQDEDSLLAQLGSQQFEKAKAKIRESLQDLARKLLENMALRSQAEGFAFSPPNEDFRNFEAQFPFVLTRDQDTALQDIFKDMESEKIMDRILCGDVGFGKTEVAMRAAYKAVLDGKQVAVLVPTTLLAFQHERTFKKRFESTGVRVEGISRLKTKKHVEKTLDDLKRGRIDILIGTHRLLSKDVLFSDLGLMIVDEEHRFGVEHKERIKQLSKDVDALTLTATPIPRTLQMSLSGLRDLSLIQTPPSERLSVKTYITPWNENILREVMENEISRGGQIYYIYNRVHDIQDVANTLTKLLPNARITLAHGQMSETDLEAKMIDFYEHHCDIFLATTIVESGLDVPRANTMIIERADTFGLAQLYQLRGRVGRSDQQGYCYLLLPKTYQPTDIAQKRLEILQRFSDLGSGFKVSTYDLEMRGAGDLFGKAQSGHLNVLGFEMYYELLHETLQELKGVSTETKIDPELKLPFAAFIPEGYIDQSPLRLSFYRRIASCTEEENLKSLQLEMEDRFGPPPTEVLQLLDLIALKQILVKNHITALSASPEQLTLSLGDGHHFSIQSILSSKVSLIPPNKIILPYLLRDLLTLKEFLKDLFSTWMNQG